MGTRSHATPHEQGWIDRAWQVGAGVLAASCCMLLAATLLRCVYLALPKSAGEGSATAPSIMSQGGVIVGGLSEDWLTSLSLGIGVTLLVSVLATALGWMTAWHLSAQSARRRRLVLALAFMPMVMPAAISYAGWWLLRQPTWPLGDYLAVHASGSVLARLGHVTAIFTMSLWLWPITSITLWTHVRSLPIEALWARAQVAGRWSVQGLALRMSRGPMVITMLLAMQLAMGSAVSLHLTQLPVPGVDVWARLALDPMLQAGWPGGLAWLVWCVMMASIVCWVFARRVIAPTDRRDALYSRPEARGLAHCAPPWIRTVTVMALIGGCLVPLVSAGLTLRRWEYILAFWREHGTSARQSLEQGLLVGLLMTIMTLAWSYIMIILQRRAARKRSQGVIVLMTAMLLALAMTVAITPGVLVGQSVGWVLLRTGLVTASSDWADLLTVPCAHSVRFAVVPIFIASILSLPASRDGADVRSSLPVNLRFMWALVWKPGLWLITLAGAAGMLLSMQEIEVALQVTPPGRRALAIVLLDMLHMNSVQELASVMVQVLLIAGAIAMLASFFAGRLMDRQSAES